MSKKEYTEDFEKNFERVFGKDRDLSELSNIDMYDFKEVMKSAVKEFRKTAPPESEECQDIIYIFWRIYKTVHLLLKHLPKQEALKLITQENFYDLNIREELIQAACNNELFPIKSSKNLIEITESIIANWKRNRDHLIKTGYTKTLIPEHDWIGGLFHNLYPEHLLLKMKYLRKDQSGDLFFEYYWRDYESPSRPEHDEDYQPVASYYKDDPTAPQPPPDSQSKFQLKCDFQYGVHIKAVKMPDDVFFKSYRVKKSDGQIATVNIRTRLYKAYMKIFELLLDSANRGKFQGVLESCFEEIVNKFRPDELLGLLERDRFLSSYKLGDADKNSHMPTFGGITKLFHLIGYFEKEAVVPIRTQQQLRKDFGSVVGNDPGNMDVSSSYIEAIRNESQRKAIDKVLEKFRDMERQGHAFWESYYVKLNELLCQNVTISDAPESLKEYMPNMSDLSVENPHLTNASKVENEVLATYTHKLLFPKKKLPAIEPQKIQAEESTAKIMDIEDEIYKRFPTPEGTVWSDVNLLVYDDHIRVVVGELNEVYQQGEIGFPRSKDRSKDIKFANKTMALNRNWIFLYILAEKQGEIDDESLLELGRKMEYDEKAILFISKHLKKYISDIRIFLKFFLQLQDDPFAVYGGGEKRIFIKSTPSNQTYDYEENSDEYFEDDYVEENGVGIENDNQESSNNDTRSMKYKPLFKVYRPSWEQVVVKPVKGNNLELNVCGVFSNKVHLSEFGYLNRKGELSDRGKLIQKILQSKGELRISDVINKGESIINHEDCTAIEINFSPKLCELTGIKQNPFWFDRKNICKILFKTDN